MEKQTLSAGKSSETVTSPDVTRQKGATSLNTVKRPVGGGKGIIPNKVHIDTKPDIISSITSDNGCEFYEHKYISKTLNINIRI